MSKSIPYIGENIMPDKPALMRMAHITFGASGCDVTLGATGAVKLFDIGNNVVVHSVATAIETAFNSSVTLALTDSDSASLLASADIAPQSASNILKNSFLAGETLAGGKRYPSGTDLTITVGGAAVTAGKGHLYVAYSEADTD